MEFTVKFVTYRGIYRNISTDKLTVPSIDGRRTILSNHMPVMIPLEVGQIETNESGKLKHYVITDGMMYFENNEATVVSDTIFCAEEIDEAMVEKYRKMMEKRFSNEDDILKAKVALARTAKYTNNNGQR